MSDRRLKIRDLSPADVAELRENIESPEGLDSGLAAQVGLFIAACSVLDMARTSLLAAIVGARFPGIHALMSGIINARARSQAAEKACKALLEDDDFVLVEAVLNRGERVERLRNRLAHGLWSWASWAPGEILVINPADFAQHLGAIQATRNAIKAFGNSRGMREGYERASTHLRDNKPKRHEFDLGKVDSYGHDDLVALVDEARRVTLMFRGLLAMFEETEFPERAEAARRYVTDLLGRSHTA